MYPVILSKDVHIIRIGNLETDLDSSDKKVEEGYINLDIPLSIFVSTTRSNQAKQNKVSKKKPIKQILQKRIQKEKRYIIQINIRFVAYEPAKVTPTLFLPILIEKTLPKETIPDIYLVAKKSVERKRHLWMVNVLKKLVEAITITKRILDLGVNLII